MSDFIVDDCYIIVAMHLYEPMLIVFNAHATDIRVEISSYMMQNWIDCKNHVIFYICYLVHIHTIISQFE